MVRGEDRETAPLRLLAVLVGIYAYDVITLPRDVGQRGLWSACGLASVACLARLVAGAA